MSERDARMVTYKEYLFMLKAKEKEYFDRWEVIRWLGWNERILTPELKHPPRRPQDLFLLPHEKQKTGQIIEITEYEISELKRIGLLRGDC